MTTLRAMGFVGMFAGASVAHAQALERPDKVVAGPAYAESSLTRTLESLADEAGMRRIDREALGHAQSYARAEHAPSPGPGPNGSVQFVEGSPVRVYCQVGQMCDIELERGETFHKAMCSDKSQWLVDRSEAAGSVHIAVQATVPNIQTTLFVYTDRRVYTFALVAGEDAAHHMPRVRFVYPQSARDVWEARMQEEGRLEEPEEAPTQRVEVRPEHLYFGYEVEKEGRWRMRRKIHWAPHRVFDDGEKTYIEMPHSMLSGEAPILLVRNAEGQAVITNYALKGVHFVVPQLFEQAILVKGNGRKQERVRIARMSEDD